MKIAEFAMDTASLAGPLPAKLRAMRAAGFGQLTLSARDLVGHEQGLEAAIAAVRASGLRVAAFGALRDFEGLSGPLHEHKVGMAKSMIQMCAALGCKVLVASASTHRQSSTDGATLSRDLHKLGMLALPHGIQIAYEALSWARTVRHYTKAWELVDRADCPNLGIALASAHVFAGKDDLDDLDLVDPLRIHLVQLSDFMSDEPPTLEENIAAGHNSRVFPGEGVNSEGLSQFVLALDRLGYRGNYSFDVSNDDYQQLPLPAVAERARRSAVWLSEDVLRRLVPLPGAMRLRTPSA
ncbi:4-hydroxyphenylpyruvate dioxygenase [Rubrivivax sp. A210]|uniref:sugar phosphate isomerase/epimerase family protein n=1 Tax=Rubrivivax sp. A210 TaxID=2772301 RepID=UPI001919E7EA|nr:sugar phosphate isomerase/epimerase family protein [Rubrivivax sp. A210]CAD5375116.1 4-hydroxyphenylpyruvate dioxygenase [Rubrivivax sp. A210]